MSQETPGKGDPGRALVGDSNHPQAGCTLRVPGPVGASLKTQRFARLSGVPSGHLLRLWPPLLRGHLKATELLFLL